MKNKRVLSFLLTLTLVFSVLTGTVFGTDGLSNTSLKVKETLNATQSALQVATDSALQAESDGITNEVVYVRIEGDTDTFVRRIEVPLEALDLSQYGASKECQGISVLEVIIRALEMQGLDAKDTNVIEHGGGSFISSICGLNTGAMSGWMYTLNGVAPQWGVNQQEVQNNDEIVLYYIEDWTLSSYAHFDTEYKEVTAGETFELTLSNDVLDMWTWDTSILPCENAEILLDDKVLDTTDAEGKVSVVFDEAGTYYLSAQKIVDGVNVISRPYCEVKVNPAPEKADFDYQAAMKTAQSWIQNKIDFSTYKYKVNNTPDWYAFALSRSGVAVPDSYFEGMEAMVNSYESIDAFKAAMKKVTEYERMTIGITASGHDATNVAGVDFIEAIYNSDIFTKQGTNGVVYGLLAVDAHNYEVPSDAIYTREKMVDILLENHIPNGGWGFSLGGTKSDVDLTAMAVQALTPYYKDSNFAKNQEVRQVVEEALNYLSSMQEENGMYKAYGNYNPESMSQVIVALSGLGIDCNQDERFIKNGNTLINALEAFYNTEDGGFKHLLTGKSNNMATQQTLYALAAYERFLNGKNNLYDMTDIVFDTPVQDEPVQNEVTLEDGKVLELKPAHQDVQIKVADNFTQVGLDFTQVATSVPGVTIQFGTHSIYLPESISLEAQNKKLDLSLVKPSALESYKAELKDASAIESAFKFGNDVDVQFSDFITLKFENAKDLETAYINEAGKLYEIVKNPNDITGLSEYCIVDGEDLVVKTKHLTTFLTYSKSESVAPEKPSIPEVPNVPEAQIQITISVDAKTINKGYMVPTKQISLKEGATAFEALESLGLNLNVVGADENVYVAAINGLGEFDHGELSGWMYNVNGKYPNVGLGSYTLSQGDVMEVRYTTNGGKDLGDLAASLIGGSGAGTLGGGSGSFDKAYNTIINEVTKILASKETVDEWELIALANQNKLSEEAKKQLVNTVVNQKGDYRKVTDLERMIIALGAAGYDAQNVAGLNLIEKLYNRDSVTNQGSNGVIFALIALDSKQYEVPANSKWTREKLIETLLTYQNEDGGFTLALGEESNVDITAMALCALSKYEEAQKTSIEKALAYLAKAQDADGEYSYVGIKSSESTAQVIIALSELGIDVKKDTRFIKENKNLIDVLTNYYVEGEGFKHVIDGSSDQMATEQALLALLSYEKFLANKEGIYSYGRAAVIEEQKADFESFKDYNEVAPWALEAMEEAVELGFVQGNNNELNPKDKVTRAEFVTILLNILGKEVALEHDHVFEDVSDEAWYNKAIYTAYNAKLVAGMQDNKFMPNANITREQMAVILDRLIDEEAVTSERPTDFESVSTWAKDSVLVMYTNGLMQGDGGKFGAKQEVTREMAVVILMRFQELYK